MKTTRRSVLRHSALAIAGTTAVSNSLMRSAMANTMSAPTLIQVDPSKTGVKISPTLYSIFFEEISRGGEGGLYGQMLQNGSFEESVSDIWYWQTTKSSQQLHGVLAHNRDALSAIPAWSLVQRGGEGTMSLDWSKPLNSNNPTSLKLTAIGGFVGAASDGFLKMGSEGKP